MGRGIAMSALRRAAAGSARGRSHGIMLAREYCADSELSRNSLVHEEGNCDNCSNISGNCIQSKSYFSRCSYSPKSFIWSRNLSSHVRARLGQKDDDLENGFSDLDVLTEADSIVEPQEEVDDDKSISEIEGEMSEEDPNGGTNDFLSDNESDSSFQKRTKHKSILSPLAKIVMETPQNSLNSALDKWVEEGNPLGRGEIFLIILNLRRRRLYWKALQASELYHLSNPPSWQGRKGSHKKRSREPISMLLPQQVQARDVDMTKKQIILCSYPLISILFRFLINSL